MSKRKYDWVELKKEFMTGDYKSVNEFLRVQNLPPTIHSGGMRRYTKGWAAEKKKKRERALERATQRSLDNQFGDMGEVKEKQARIAHFLQTKGMKELEDLSSESVDEARRLVLTGMKQERAIFGIGEEGRQASPRGQQLTQVNINLPPTRFDDMIEEMDYEQLVRFIAELKRVRVGRNLPEDSGPSGPEAKVGGTT